MNTRIPKHAFVSIARTAALICAAGFVTIPFVIPTVPNEITLGAKITFIALGVFIAVNDFRTQTVSPALTLTWMWMGIVRAIVMRDPTFLAYWLVIFLLWSLHFYGGGDAKLLMGLFGLMPDLRLVWLTCAVLVVTGVPVLVKKYWRTSPRVLASGLSQRAQTGAWLPTDEELNRGVPFAFAYCIAGALYMWLFL